MAKNSHNEGIIQSGGSINVGGSLGVGRGVVVHSESSELRIVSREKALLEIDAHLQALLQAIAQNVQSSSDRENLQRQTHTIAEELHQEKPDKSRLQSILESLATCAKSISPVFGLVEGLQGLVKAFLH